MPVTGCKRAKELSQRDAYNAGGVGRKYWDFRDSVVLGHVSGTRILDAGCGEGITLQKIADLFPLSKVEGVDIDLENVRICNEHNLTVQQGNLYELPFDNGHFDCCIFIEVIEHLDYPEKAVAELGRVTRPGGKLILVYPIDWAMWLARIACMKFKEARFDSGHLRQWTMGELAHCFKQAGFQLLRSRAIPLPPPLMLHGLAVGERNE